MNAPRGEEEAMADLRERTLDDLSVHYSKDRLDLDEYERRAARAAAAQDRLDLESLTADLPALRPQTAAGRVERPSTRERGLSWSVNEGKAMESGMLFSLFSGSLRRGSWRAPRSLRVLSIFGGSRVDLREAIVPPDGMTINVLSVFGGASVVVPPGLNLEVSGIGVFGGFAGPSRIEDIPGAPTIRVRGLAVFGGANVAIRR